MLADYFFISLYIWYLEVFLGRVLRRRLFRRLQTLFLASECLFLASEICRTRSAQHDIILLLDSRSATPVSSVVEQRHLWSIYSLNPPPSAPPSLRACCGGALRAVNRVFTRVLQTILHIFVQPDFKPLEKLLQKLVRDKSRTRIRLTDGNAANASALAAVSHSGRLRQLQSSWCFKL